MFVIEFIPIGPNGNELWSFNAKLDKLNSGQEYRQRFQSRTWFPSGLPALPLLMIEDINHDKSVEVLFCPKIETQYYEPGLFCFDSRGREIWNYKPGRELDFDGRVYSGDYRIEGFEVYDVDGDGNLEIFLIAPHQPHSPCELVVLDFQGTELEEYYDWGRINDIAYAAFSTDWGMAILGRLGSSDRFPGGDRKRKAQSYLFPKGKSAGEAGRSRNNDTTSGRRTHP